MSQCVVPNWNLRQQRAQERSVVVVVEGEEGNNRSSHVQPDQRNLSYVVPMPNYEVTELTWENGQLGLHGLGGILPPPPPPPPQTKQQTWGSDKPGDHTLESIVHHATKFPPHYFAGDDHSDDKKKYSRLPPPRPTSSAGKWGETNLNNSSSSMAAPPSHGGEWRPSSSAKVVNPVRNNNNNFRENEEKGVKMISSMAASSSGGNNKRVRTEFQVEESACASASATFCRDADATMMTWASFESPRSLKAARNADNDDSAYQDCSENQDGERMTKGESFRSQSSARRSRAATIHNQSERRRRDRINEKMKALQKLVPNASKTDKASMLDEVIEYLKQLQSQVHMMSNARNMPQMVMPNIGMQQQQQQQLQMALLARMGMGMGMGSMLHDVNNLARNHHHAPHSFPQLIHASSPLGGPAPSFVTTPFNIPPMMPPQTNPMKANDVYKAFIAQQSMNMDFLNKMSALYGQQQANQIPKKSANNSSLPNHGQGE